MEPMVNVTITFQVPWNPAGHDNPDNISECLAVDAAGISEMFSTSEAATLANEWSIQLTMDGHSVTYVDTPE